MAIRATLTAAGAMVAAVAIESTALPRLATESKGLSSGPPAQLQWLGAFQGHLVFVPVPALLLGMAAIVFAPARSALAVLSTLVGAVALLIIVGTVVAAMAPLYQAPRDLQLP